MDLANEGDDEDLIWLAGWIKQKKRKGEKTLQLCSLDQPAGALLSRHVELIEISFEFMLSSYIGIDPGM